MIAEAVAEAIGPLKGRIAELEAEVARLKKNSTTSSKPPSSDIIKPPRPPAGGGNRASDAPAGVETGTQLVLTSGGALR